LFWDREPLGEEEEYGRLDEDLSWDEEPPGEEEDLTHRNARMDLFINLIPGFLWIRRQI
jgi:hypothetical protein